MLQDDCQHPRPRRLCSAGATACLYFALSVSVVPAGAEPATTAPATRRGQADPAMDEHLEVIRGDLIVLLNAAAKRDLPPDRLQEMGRAISRRVYDNRVSLNDYFRELLLISAGYPEARWWFTATNGSYSTPMVTDTSMVYVAAPLFDPHHHEGVSKVAKQVLRYVELGPTGAIGWSFKGPRNWEY